MKPKLEIVQSIFETPDSTETQPVAPTPEPPDALFDPPPLSQGGGAVTYRRQAVELRRPKDGEWFRTKTDPEFDRVFQLLPVEEAGRRQIYWLTAEIMVRVKPSLAQFRLIPFITRDGACGLWPIKENEWGPNGYLDSALAAAHTAFKLWTHIRNDSGKREYEIVTRPATTVSEEPEWPERTPAQWRKLAFINNLILNSEHPVIQKILWE